MAGGSGILKLTGFSLSSVIFLIRWKVSVSEGVTRMFPAVVIFRRNLRLGCFSSRASTTAYDASKCSVGVMRSLVAEGVDGEVVCSLLFVTRCCLSFFLLSPFHQCRCRSHPERD